MITLEICVDTVAGLNAAIEGGADRIELCSALGVGGLSPSLGLLDAARSSPVPVFVMVRPRAGDFDYSNAELTAMQLEIAQARDMRFAGVVFGAGTENGLHTAALEHLCRAADGVGKTLHRVVDLLPDRGAILNAVRDLGFDRVLTSGGQTKVEAGLADLRALVGKAPDGLSIMPGSGVTAENVGRILSVTGAREIHASASMPVKAVSGRLTDLGFSPEHQKVTTAESVRKLKVACLAV